MKKFVYLCGMILLCLNMQAQIPDREIKNDDGFCYGTMVKNLSVPQPGNNLPITPGWRKYSAFSDDFDGNQLDLTKWKIKDNMVHSHHPYVGFHNSPSNVHVENGKLYLTLTHNTEGVVFPYNEGTTIPTYLSGWISTQNPIRYGYFETECYLPLNHKYWPCFWTLNPITQTYVEVDVFERKAIDGVAVPDKLLQNCYAANLGQRSDLTQILTFPQSMTDNTYVFGVEVLPNELVFYINGRVTSHIKYDETLYNDWNTYTCTDMLELNNMYLILSFTCHTSDNDPILPEQSTWFEYVHSYKLERGETNTYHPTTFVPSDESTKVYPHVILGGTGCTANVSTSTAIWAEQDIVLDKGFELTANTPFSARVISVPDTIHSHLYINKR